MSDFTLEGYRAQLKNVARPYLFYCLIPVKNAEVQILKFLVSSHTVPSRTISELPTNWQGYTYYWAGVSTWESWQCNFILESNMKGYTDFIKWMKDIHDPDTNKHGDPDDYETKSVKLQQLEHQTGAVLYQWELHNVWPQTTAGYEMSYSATDSPASFAVTFRYQWATFDN